MKKIIALSLLCLFIGVMVIAQKKKRIKRKPLPAVRYETGHFTYRKGGVRIIGHVYEFTIRTYYPNIVLDSVWFGATPVPCDVYNSTNGQKIDTAKMPGIYIVKANKDLYRNFSNQIDSSIAANNFKAPFHFMSDAYIMYLHKGKRNYLPASGLEQRADKPLRQ